MWCVKMIAPCRIYFMLIILPHLHNGCLENKNCKRCDVTSGRCVACKQGYFGTQCDKQCSRNCRYNTCKVSLNSGADECQEGCKQGFFGKRCSVRCHSPGPGCLKCDSGCQDGYCLDNFCISDCRGSFYGLNCFHCASSCKSCNNVTGECNECIRDYGGPNCSDSCQNCLGSCKREGCHIGCKSGYYGTFCNDMCDANCVGGCDQNTSKCNDCEDGRYGSHCQSRCSKGCTDETCSFNGQCFHGCKDGYFGPKCASTCKDACRKNKCNAETRPICIQLCKTCSLSCSGKPVNCSETCLSTFLSSLCAVITTPTTSKIDKRTTTSTTLTTTATLEKDDYLVVYLAVSVTGLVVMMVTLFVYFSCKFQRFRRFMYGSVRLPTIHLTHPVQPVDQSVPSDSHEYDEVEDASITIDLANPIIAEVFGNESSASTSTSFPRMADYSTMKGVNAEGEYLTPRADPLQRAAYRHTL